MFYAERAHGLPGHLLVSWRDVEIETSHDMIALESLVDCHNSSEVEIVHGEVQVEQ